MRSDPALIGAFRKQVRTVLAGGDAAAFLGLWASWKDQSGVCRDDLVDVLEEEGGIMPVAGDQPMTAKELRNLTVVELAELVRPMADGLVIIMDDGARVRVKMETPPSS